MLKIGSMQSLIGLVLTASSTSLCTPIIGVDSTKNGSGDTSMNQTRMRTSLEGDRMVDPQRLDRLESRMQKLASHQCQIDVLLESAARDSSDPEKDREALEACLDRIDNGDSGEEPLVGPAAVSASPTLTHQPFPFIGPSALFFQHSSIDAPIGFSLNQGFEVVSNWTRSKDRVDLYRMGCCRDWRVIKSILSAPVTLPLWGLQWLYGTGKDSLYYSGGFVYSGQYDFAFGSQYSGPVISLEQNPALFVGYHGISRDSSGENAIFVGVSHQSNGMFLDHKSMFDAFDTLPKLNSLPLHGQEYASMGWNYWWIRPVWNWGAPGAQNRFQQWSLELRHYIPQNHLFPWQSGRLEDTSNFIDPGTRLGYEQYDGLRIHYSFIGARTRCNWRPGFDANLQLGQPFRNTFDFGEELRNGSFQVFLRLILDKPVANSHANGFGLQAGWEYGHILLARYWARETRLSIGFTLPIQSSWDF